MQVKSSKTLDFVNNSAFLLISEGLKPFVFAGFEYMYAMCICCIPDE